MQNSKLLADSKWSWLYMLALSLIVSTMSYLLATHGPLRNSFWTSLLAPILDASFAYLLVLGTVRSAVYREVPWRGYVQLVEWKQVFHSWGYLFLLITGLEALIIWAQESRGAVTEWTSFLTIIGLILGTYYGITVGIEQRKIEDLSPVDREVFVEKMDGVDLQARIQRRIRLFAPHKLSFRSIHAAIIIALSIFLTYLVNTSIAFPVALVLISGLWSMLQTKGGLFAVGKEGVLWIFRFFIQIFNKKGLTK